MSTVYLNGEFLPVEQARVSVMDRGFLFGDGVYEVIPVYGAHPFRLAEHLQRLERSLHGIRLANPLSAQQWREVLERLVARNGGRDQSLYLQVTRGEGPREHAFPDPVRPTVFAMSMPLAERAHAPGVRAVTAPDIRWALCDIKAITLLPNALLRQQAVDAGAAEAILIRNALLTEGAASNVFVVQGAEVATPPKSAQLLPGITRDLVVELLRAAGVDCQERLLTETELRSADEIWITSSTREVVPVIELDGAPVGPGAPGPLWRRAWELYQGFKQRVREQGTDAPAA